MDYLQQQFAELQVDVNGLKQRLYGHDHKLTHHDALHQHTERQLHRLEDDIHELNDAVRYVRPCLGGQCHWRLASEVTHQRTS